jgi:sugar lactone lactonase YvrE
VIDVYAHQEDSLGEGVLWDGETVWWVDIIRGLVHRGPDTTFEIGGPVGSLALIEGGRIGLALRTHLALLDPSDGTIDPWVEIESDRPANRLNDGRVDRSGRWWVGSMDAGAVGETGALYRVEAGVVTRIFDQLAIPNSLAVSPGNDFLYFTQTVNRIIFRFKLRPDGDLGSGQRFAEVAGPGVPDGACVDEDGCLQPTSPARRSVGPTWTPSSSPPPVPGSIPRRSIASHWRGRCSPSTPGSAGFPNQG